MVIAATCRASLRSVIVLVYRSSATPPKPWEQPTELKSQKTELPTEYTENTEGKTDQKSSPRLPSLVPAIGNPREPLPVVSVTNRPQRQRIPSLAPWGLGLASRLPLPSLRPRSDRQRVRRRRGEARPWGPVPRRIRTHVMGCLTCPHCLSLAAQAQAMQAGGIRASASLAPSAGCGAAPRACSAKRRTCSGSAGPHHLRMSWATP